MGEGHHLICVFLGPHVSPLQTASLCGLRFLPSARAWLLGGLSPPGSPWWGRGHHLTRVFSGPHKSPLRTALRSGLQFFRSAHAWLLGDLAPGVPIVGEGSPPNTCLPWSTHVSTPNGISIRLAVFAQRARAGQTDRRQTDGPRHGTALGKGRILHFVLAMRPKNERFAKNAMTLQ